RAQPGSAPLDCREPISWLPGSPRSPPRGCDGAPRRRIQVYAVGLRPDGDERRGLLLAPRSFGLIDVGGAREPGDRHGGYIGDGKVAVQRLLESDRVPRAVLDGEAQ